MQAVEIADEMEYAQSQSEARGDLARAQLLSGDLELAAAAVEAALKYPFPRIDAQASLIYGIVLIRQGRRQHARDAFSEAVAHAESQLQCATTNFTALDTKALALCGLAVLGDGFRLDEATRAFRAVREVTDAAGVVKRVLDLLAELSIADSTSVLGSSVRAAAIGKTKRELT